jgi:hypothetical protein
MVNFNFSYAPGTSLQQMVGFETAGRIWSSYLTDNVTVNLHAGVSSSLPSNVIGGALPGIQANQRYETWRTRLASDITSAHDLQVYQNQQDDPDKFTALIDGYKVDNNETLNVTRANAKALGMLSGGSTALDGSIVLSDLSASSFSWSYDYTRQNAAPANSLDFLSTAIHEIGHILGFVSGIDKPGWLTQKTQYDSYSQDDFYSSLTGQLGHATPLDMFRFSAESVRQAGQGDSWIDMSVGGDPYFSSDGGKSAVSRFATGKNTDLGGDGEQASHWKDGTAGVLDPNLAVGERLSISGTDLQALDVIGWNLKPTTGSLTLDLSALKSQSDQALAQRLRITVASLYADAGKSAQKLSSNETGAVNAMIKDSQVYDWGRKPPTSSSSGSLSQVIDLLQNQTIYGSFDTLDDEVGGSQKSTIGVDSSAPVSSAARLKLSAMGQQRFAVALPVAGSIQAVQLSSEALTQVIRSITAPVLAAQSSPQGWVRGRQIEAESKLSKRDGFHSRSTNRKFSGCEDLVGTDDLLAL